MKFDGAGSARIDDVALVHAGPAKIDTVEQGSFQLKSVDGRQLELFCGGVPTLAMGRLVAMDAEGKEVAASDLAVSAAKDGDQGFLVQITGGAGAAAAALHLIALSRNLGKREKGIGFKPS